jgi:DNA-binding NtrC family response regulator
LRVPPLRERMEDLEPIALYFTKQLGETALPPDVLEAFRRHSWPGNVREVKNAIQAFSAVGSVSLSPPAEIGELQALLERLIDVSKPYAEQKERIVEWFSRAYFEKLLASTGGNQSEAARIAGLERSYFGKLAQKLARRDKADENDGGDAS